MSLRFQPVHELLHHPVELLGVVPRQGVPGPVDLEVRFGLSGQTPGGRSSSCLVSWCAMNSDQLQALASEISRGRTEDQKTDWKKRWYDLKEQQAKEEFRKDIAALANSCGEGPGQLVIGLKEGSFFDAPLPKDEAELQQILKEISPPPNASFEEIVVRGDSGEARVTVVSVLPPYDRPYVSKRGDLSLVPVRRGSSTGTATRFELDSFYRPKTRLPELVVSWEHWPSKSLAKEKGTVAEVLPVANPRIRLPEFCAELRSCVERYEAERRDTGYPTLEQIETFCRQAEEFMAALESRPNLVYWYYKQSNFFYATPFSVIVTNNGTQVATQPKVRIRFPDWFFVFDEAPKKPKSYVPEPFMPRPPEKRQVANRRHGTDRRLDLLSLPSSLLRPLQEPCDGSWTNSDGTSANFWATRIQHRHHYRIGNSLRIMALPTAPMHSGILRFKQNYFVRSLIIGSVRVWS